MQTPGHCFDFVAEPVENRLKGEPAILGKQVFLMLSDRRHTRLISEFGGIKLFLQQQVIAVKVVSGAVVAGTCSALGAIRGASAASSKLTFSSVPA